MTSQLLRSLSTGVFTEHWRVHQPGSCHANILYSYVSRVSLNQLATTGYCIPLVVPFGHKVNKKEATLQRPLLYTKSANNLMPGCLQQKTSDGLLVTETCSANALLLHH